MTLGKLRVVFMGSPEFALPALQTLHEMCTVVGVVTQPDRPSGRGRKLSPPPVKSLAQELDLPIIQPARLTEKATMERFSAWAPELIVVAAFGQILRKKVLDLPKYGCINVHASLLPRWRGAAPIQAAISAGDSESGISIIKMDEGLDTGPVISTFPITLTAEETAGSLSSKLAALGGQALAETLPGYIDGQLLPLPQREEDSTYAPMLKTSDGELDFSMPVNLLVRKVRAYFPWPGTFFRIGEMRIKVHEADEHRNGEGAIGKMKIIDGLPAVAAADGYLILKQLQAPGKQAMSGEDYLRGNPEWKGSISLNHIKEQA